MTVIDPATGTGGPPPSTRAATRPFDRKLPPVVPFGMGAIALAITGGVLLVSQIGQRERLALPTALIAVAILLELVAVVLMARIKPFAWWRFRQVFMWALVAYVIQSAIIEWTFIKNDVPSGP